MRMPFHAGKSQATNLLDLLNKISHRNEFCYDRNDTHIVNVWMGDKQQDLIANFFLNDIVAAYSY